MGKIYGSNRVIGTIGGIRHYKIEGCDAIIAAEKGGVNRNIIKNNPAYARTRENNLEWKGVTALASQVKEALGINTARVVNRFLIGALNKAMKDVMCRDSGGKHGQRSIFLSKHKNILDTVQYWYYKSFRDLMKNRFEVDTGPDRRMVTVRLADLIPKEQVIPPVEATHFQLCLSIGAVCDFICDTGHKRYSGVYSDAGMLLNLSETESAWIPVNASSLGDVILSVALPEKFSLEDDMTVLRTLGIIFGKMTFEVELLKRERGSAEFLGAV